jgi:hypothetical protein
VASVGSKRSVFPLWYGLWCGLDYVVMVDAEGVVAIRRACRFRTVSEKRRISELTFEPGASVALVAVLTE